MAQQQCVWGEAKGGGMQKEKGAAEEGEVGSKQQNCPPLPPNFEQGGISGCCRLPPSNLLSQSKARTKEMSTSQRRAST